MLRSMATRPRSRIVLYVLAALAAFYLLYFAGLGRNPLVDPDEPIYGQFVKEMVTTGDWVTPHYAGELWFDKPPLFYWLSSVCVKVLGQSELAIRFPSAVCAVLVVLMVYLLASYDFGKRAGVLAATVMATTLMQVIMSHAAATDALMVFLMAVALYAYRRWLDSSGFGRLGWITACGAATGLGLLTKGPVVPLLLAVTFALHLVWTRQLGKLRLLDVLAGVGVCLAIGMPWYVAMYTMHHRTFVDQFILENNFARFLKPLHKSQTGQWYSYLRNVPMLLAFFFPWSVFLPRAIRKQWQSNAGSKLAICWIAVTLVFFSISKTQNFTYTYPTFIACAVLVGALLGRAEEGRGYAKFLSSALWIGLSFAILIAAALLVIARGKYPTALNAAIPVALALVSVFAMPIVWTRWRRPAFDRAPWLIAAGVIAFSLLTVNVLLPRVSDFTSSKALAQRLSATPDAQVAAFKLWRPGLFYYLSEKPLDADDASDVKRLSQCRMPVLFVCQERDEHEVELYCPIEIYGCGNLDVYANQAYLAKAAANPATTKATKSRAMAIREHHTD